MQQEKNEAFVPIVTWNISLSPPIQEYLSILCLSPTY